MTSEYVKTLIDKAYEEQASFLDLGNCGLREVPGEIVKLAPWLKKLNIGSRYVSDEKYVYSKNSGERNIINDSDSWMLLRRLTGLTNLYISSNSIGEKGAELVSGLTGLTNLDISLNSIGEKGAVSVSRLTGLTNLDISSNGIREKGAASVSRLTGLTNLDISLNSIGEKGAVSVSCLTGLTNLDISYNSIREKGAASVSRLTGLTNLDISYNSIGEKGMESVSRLTGLTNLDISSNSIGERGAASVSRLIGLTNLDINNNSIGEKGMEYVSRLTGLTNLDVSYNSIGEKGTEYVSRLTGLTNLDISRNSIGDKGAASLSVLISLTNLYISRNSVGEKGAASLSVLISLTNLDISGNSVGEKGAASLSGLTCLTNLDIRGNSVGEKGAVSLSGLTCLTNLDIRGNRIGDKGAASLSSLTGVMSLNISSNVINNRDTLKKLVTDLPNLTVFDFADNEIAGLPKDIGTGVNSLRAYFQSVKRNNTLVKMVLIGNTTAGKSSLADYLVTQKFVAERESTHGIELWRWKTGDDAEDLQVNIWDFGGQDYFHATHNIFLTDKTAFLLLHTSREIHLLKSNATPEQWLPVNYWLGNIREMSSNDSLIWAVRTKSDLGNTKQIDELKGKQYCVEREFNISVKKDFAAFGKDNYFQQFRNILIEKLETMAKDELPLVWVEVRDKWLPVWRETENQFLTKDEFKRLCVQAFKEKPGLLKDLDYVDEMVRYLGRTGEIVVFEEETLLSNMIFLSAPKLTKQLYKTVLSEQVRDAKGIIDMRQFGADRLTEVELYIKVLLAYGLIFHIREDKYVAPQYLPENEYESELAGGYPLRLVIHFPDYMSRSMIARFIVEFAGKDEQSKYWRYGAYFRLNGMPMFVRIDADKQKVYLHSKDTDKDNFEECILKLFLFFVGKKIEDNEKRSGKYSWRHGDDFLDKPFSYGGTGDSYLVRAGIELSVDDRKFATVKEIKTSMKIGGNVVRIVGVETDYMIIHEIFSTLLKDRVNYIRRIIFLYAEPDRSHKTNLQKQFSSLDRIGKVVIWDEGQLLAGDNKNTIIEAVMEDTEIAILLLSSDCIASDHIWNIQIPAARKCGVQIFPVFLRKCIVPAQLLSGMLNCNELAENRKWIIDGDKSPDDGFMQVVREVERLIE